MKRKKIDIDKIKLTKSEREIEAAIERGEYKPVSQEEFERIKASLDAFNKKDAVLNMRINSGVLNKIKAKAKSLGVGYQTYIAQALRELSMK